MGWSLNNSMKLSCSLIITLMSKYISVQCILLSIHVTYLVFFEIYYKKYSFRVHTEFPQGPRPRSARARRGCWGVFLKGMFAYPPTLRKSFLTFVSALTKIFHTAVSFSVLEFCQRSFFRLLLLAAKEYLAPNQRKWCKRNIYRPLQKRHSLDGGWRVAEIPTQQESASTMLNWIPS